MKLIEWLSNIAPQAELSLNYAATSQRKLPYYSRRVLMTPTELRFYTVLRQAVGREFGVMSKVRLADVVTCPRRLWDTPVGRRISQKHLDFLLIDPETTSLVAAIELNDRSHERADRQARDRFVNEILQGAGVPLLTFLTARSYDARDLRQCIDAALVIRPQAMKQAFSVRN